MGGADVGGDGSVQWHVWGENVKQGSEVVVNRGANGREHQHIDNTDPGQRFRISIEVPPTQAEAQVFLESFAQALDAAQSAAPGTRLNFELPIVPAHTQQIQIRWDSSAQAAGHRPRDLATAPKLARRSGGAAVKKGLPKKVAKRGATKTSKKSKGRNRKAAGKKKR